MGDRDRRDRSRHRIASTDRQRLEVSAVYGMPPTEIQVKSRNLNPEQWKGVPENAEV
jgi:hypothetical protein